MLIVLMLIVLLLLLLLRLVEATLEGVVAGIEIIRGLGLDAVDDGAAKGVVEREGGKMVAG